MHMKKWIVANWKMNGDLNLVKSYIETFNNYSNLIVAPPFVYLKEFAPMLCAGQNVHCENNGAFTGEISAEHLKNVGAKFCLVGHSERRNFFNETNSIVKSKALKCIEHNIVPIICIGESLNDYENGKTENVLQNQMNECLPNDGNFWIAYEPLWAIGTGKTPTLDEIQQIQKFIKNYITNNVNVLYGGSVKASNAGEILRLPEVDGVLVGGASLDTTEITTMLKLAIS